MWKPLCIVLIQILCLYTLSPTKTGEAVSALYPAIATAAYLGFVYFGKLAMRGRKAFQLNEYMFSYNLYQMVLNAYCAFSILGEARSLGMRVWGNPVDESPRASRLAFLVWLHYQNKYIELADTALMVLRKKHKQITFLHVYHHLLLLWSWYGVCKIACGGDAYFGAAINSITHVLMYAYYLGRTIGYACPWKVYLTRLQIIQFAVCTFHGLYTIFVQANPVVKVLGALEVFVMANMLVLFRQFYIASYSERSSSMARRNNDASTYTLAQVAEHNSRHDAWVVVHGDVLDITEFINDHPGGDIIALACGRDATIMFEQYHLVGVSKTIVDRLRIGRIKDESHSYYDWSGNFYPEMKMRVARRLRELKRVRRGGSWHFAKAAIILASLALSWYFCWIAPPTKSLIWAFGLSTIFGIASAHVGLTIQHDANHGAFSTSPLLNKLGGMTMDLIGASGVCWEYQHVIGHHQFTNLHNPGTSGDRNENDPDVFSSFPLMRMHPDNPRKAYHKYQHIYAFPLFAMMTLGKVFSSDIKFVLAGKIAPGGLRGEENDGTISMHARMSETFEKVRFVAFKLLNFSALLIIPSLIHGVGYALAITVWAHLLCGEYLAVCFIVNHVGELCHFFSTSGDEAPKSKSKRDSVPERDWAKMQALATTNWAPGSHFWNLFFGAEPSTRTSLVPWN